MGARRYVHVSYPWDAFFDSQSAAPANFYAALMNQALRYTMPAKRFGPVGARMLGHGVSTRGLAAVLKIRPRGARADLDRLLDDLASAWPTLAERSARLPASPPQLSLLTLARSAAQTVFVFEPAGRPLLICKVPGEDAARVDDEARALDRAAPAEIAPIYLGRVGDARIQEGLDGEPLDIEPVRPEMAGRLPWRIEHAELAAGLTRLSEVTTTRNPPDELLAPIERAVKDGPLSGRGRAMLASAVRDLTRLEVSVLRHGDTSPQNCLFSGGRLQGLVDWELAQARGVPGFDMMNAAVAYLEQGVGFVRWSEQRALEAFRAAWECAPLFIAARAAAEDAAAAAGVPDNLLPALTAGFFGRRLGRRLAHPDAYATGPETAARMLESACLP